MLGATSQRILQALGVPLWIPRAMQPQPLPKGSIWRDNCPAESLTSPKDLTQSKALAQPIPIPTSPLASSQTALQSLKTRLASPLPVESDPKPSAILTTPTPPTQAPLNSENTLSIQVTFLVQTAFIILACPQSDHDQQLLQKIQSAAQAQLRVLQWPIPSLPWHSTDAMLIPYLTGVFHGYSTQQRIVLGQLPEAFNGFIPSAQHFSSLSQLADNIAEKKRLWQLIQQALKSQKGS